MHEDEPDKAGASTIADESRSFLVPAVPNTASGTAAQFATRTFGKDARHLERKKASGRYAAGFLMQLSAQESDSTAPLNESIRLGD